MAINLTVMSIDFDSFEEPINKTFFKNEITIGRENYNDLALDRPEISSSHVKIYVKTDPISNQNFLVVKDLGSTNGTMVERDLLDSEEEMIIHQNQRLIIGTYLIKPTLVEEEKSNFSTLSEIQNAFDKPLDVDNNNIILEEESYLDDNDNEPEISKIPAETQAVEIPSSLADDNISSEVEAPISLVQENNLVAEISTAKAVPNFIKESAINFAKIVISDQDQNLFFEASELFNLNGAIKRNGEAVSDVRVNAGSLGNTLSNQNGEFSFENIEEGSSYNLTISKEGYTFESNSLSGILEQNKEIQIRAYKLHSISGRILHKGSALAGVLIEIPNIGTTVSAEDGTFRIENIREGSTYQIKLHKEKYQFDLLEGTGIINRDINLTINSTKLVNISGKIVHKGKPVEGVEIECVNIGKTKSNFDGSYTIENVPEGKEYTLKASKIGFVFKPSKAIN